MNSLVIGCLCLRDVALLNFSVLDQEDTAIDCRSALDKKRRRGASAAELEQLQASLSTDQPCFFRLPVEKLSVFRRLSHALHFEFISPYALMSRVFTVFFFFFAVVSFFLRCASFLFLKVKSIGGCRGVANFGIKIVKHCSFTNCRDGESNFLNSSKLLYINKYFTTVLQRFFKKNLNASKPSEHPPQVEECLKV